MPAGQPGTGVIAGGGVRAVLELGGVRDVLTKSIGTQNPINLVKATMEGLHMLRKPEDVAKLRGLSVRECSAWARATEPRRRRRTQGRCSCAGERGDRGRGRRGDSSGSR